MDLNSWRKNAEYDEEDMVYCNHCSDIVGNEKEVYGDETVDYEMANGELVCIPCYKIWMKEYKNDLDPHYSPFYAETFEARTHRKSYDWENRKFVKRPDGKHNSGQLRGYDHSPKGTSDSKLDWDSANMANTRIKANLQGKEDLRNSKKNAEYNVEFNEWADQELMSHGKDISFKDWAQDEGMKHGNTEITEWAQHEDESHDARYGAETFNAYSQESRIQNLIEKLYDDREIALNKLLKINNPSLQNLISKNALLRDRVGDMTLAEWSQVQNQLKYTPSGRIRTFGAETFEDCEVCYATVDKGTLNDVQAGRICNECHKMNQYDAESSGQWEIGEQLEEAQMNAEWERSWLVKSYPHTITKEQHDEIIKLLDEHDPNANIFYVRYGDTMRIITPHGPLNPSFLPTFSAESSQFPSMHYGDHDSDAQEKYQEFLDEWDGDDDPPSFEEWEKQLDEYDRKLQEYEGMNAEDQNKDLLKWVEDYLWDNDKKGYQDYHAHRKSLGLSAEERKKRSSLLSEPHEGTSLDSGEWKGILTGFGIGLLGLFGYSKLGK